MSEIGKRIAQVVRTGLGPALKAAGFRKDGNVFRLEGPGQTRLVAAQGSSSNSGLEGRFTLNLAVDFPAVRERLQEAPLRGRPTEAGCTLRMRIGRLMPGGRDHWWSVTAATDLEAVARELTDLWTTCARPWLERMMDPVQAAAELERQGLRPRAAALWLELGRPAEAERIWRDALARPSTEGHARWWGETLGLRE